jgi:micrococcal nuclease
MAAKWPRAALAALLLLAAHPLAATAQDAARQDTMPADSGPPGPVRATWTCTVTRIADGDTFECAGEALRDALRCERAGRVRPIGIDAPELDQAPHGALAAEALAALIPPGSEVELERDVELCDPYGRLLAHVWAKSTLVNWEMVRRGWAMVYTVPPNVQYVEWLVAAQERARAERAGLWSSGGFECPPADRRRGLCE